MAIRTDQFTNSLTVVDTVNANASLSLIPQGTGSISMPGTGQNFLLQSNTFSNVAWIKNTVTLTGSQSDPFGGSTATKVDATGGDSYLYQAYTVATGLTYTFSVYLRADTNTSLLIRLYDTLSALSTDVSVTATTSWQRFSVTRTVGSGTTEWAIIGSLGTLTTGETIYAYGTQVEIGSVANTYIPTTTSAIYGTPTLSFSGVSGLGLQSDGSLYASSAGTGNVRLYTNNVAQEQARISHTASAVNYVQVTGNATTGQPSISAQGSDTNISMAYIGKGIGGHIFSSGNSANIQFIVNNTTSAINYLQVAGGISGDDPSLSSAGSQSRNIRYRSGSGASHLFETGTYANLQAAVSNTASAVNWVQLTGAATGGQVMISSQGSDSNISLGFTAKLFANTNFYAAGGFLQFQVAPTASAVNYFQAKGGATGFGAVLSAQGSDTNIPAVVQPKGTGALQAQQTDSTATGGNARGSNAVDWQMSRGAASSVASGTYSVVGGGASNGVNSAYGGTLSGVSNNTTGFASVISGGWSNSATGGQAAVVGGYSNSATGAFNFIGGGTLNSGTANAAVTTQSATMNGTTAVTLSASNANIKVGQYITGTSISFNTYVAAISGTSLTLSQAAGGSSTSTLSFFTPYSAVVGGGNNQATGSYSFIGGGGDAGTAGNRNVASGDWSVVTGGFKNTATAAGSFVGGGGTYGDGSSGGNSAISQGSSVVGGFNNVASGFISFVGGGNSNTANGQYSFIGGGAVGTTRSIQGNHVFPAHNAPVSFSSGASQAGLLILGKETTNATPTVLVSGGTTGSTTNQVVMPNNSAYFFTGEVVAGVTGGGNTKGWTIEGVIKRGANAAATTLVGSTVTSTYGDVGASTWAIAVTADTTNGGLAVTFTGQLATTIRVVAQIRTTEMTF